MGNLAVEFTGRLFKGKKIASNLRMRSRSFVTMTLDKRLLSDYEGTDWVVEKENKKSVVLADNDGY